MTTQRPIRPTRIALVGVLAAMMAVAATGAALWASPDDRETAAAGIAPRGEGTSPASGTLAPSPVAEPVLLPAPPTSTTAPPTTAPPPPPPSTTAPPPPPPPPSTTAPPPPPPPSTTAPPPPSTTAPAPATTAPPSATFASDLERATAALEAAVPTLWRAAVPHTISIIDGDTSWAWSDGRLKISRSHASGGWDLLRVVVAHEFGHLIAYRYGSGAFLGAGPAGWPYPGPVPEEVWAECVAVAFTGLVFPHPGVPDCPDVALAWTRTWLAAGPPR